MASSFNELLAEAGISVADVRLMRHRGGGPNMQRSPYEMWRDDRPSFDLYQSIQAISDRTKLVSPFWAVFAATPQKETIFLGLYRAKYLGLLDRDVVFPGPPGICKAGSYDEYQLTLDERLQEHIGKLLIDWSIGQKAWIQYAVRRDKSILNDASEIPQSKDFLPVSQPKMHDLNVILFGPPGTGKTYDTIRRAVEICDGTTPPNREGLVKRFEELRKESRVSFVTFHQSYGYEDFVEGLRPVLDENEPTTSDATKDIRYECRPGVFKQLCELAKLAPLSTTDGLDVDWREATIWKMSLGDSNDPDDAIIYEECMKESVIRLGYGGDANFEHCNTRSDILRKLQEDRAEVKPTDFDVTAVESLKLGMKEGDLVVISDGNRKIRAIGRICGPYKFLDTDNYRQARPVQWLVQLKESLPREVIYNKNLSQMTIYRLRNDDIRREALGQLVSPTASVVKNFVLVIDEINRGNISKILGELITQLEPDKRLGAENELQVTLPNSGTLFGVPQNVFLIGTMNTADRSIAFLDVALRRRFKFVEMMPDYLILEEDYKKYATQQPVNPARLLRVINERIELLYDRDHQIGHSFFLGVTTLIDLRDVFCGQIIPLLQEYFYSDWAKVCMVLGCPADPESPLLQNNPSPVILARSLTAASLLMDSADLDDKLTYSINPGFSNAADPATLQPFFTSMQKLVAAS